MDFVGKVDGETFPGGTGEGMDIELGSGGMVPGFEDQLVGVKAGDDRQIEVTFPDDYGPETLNGKDATFACHIVAIRRREVPELDDEFAKDLGEEFETLEQLRDDIREKITEGDERLSEQALHRSLMSSLIELSEFDVPGGIVDRQLESQLRSMHEQYHGRVPEDVLHGHLDRMQEEGRPMAERRVREQLLLEELAKAHDISADEADVDARLEEMAAARGIEVSQLRSMAEKQGWLDALSTEARDMKIYALLSEQAEIEKVYEENEPDD
jgi:trigger factor